LEAGKDATGIPRKTRSRLQQLAEIPEPELGRLKTKLRSQERDVTVNSVLEAVAQEKVEGERQARRAEYAARVAHGQTIDDLHKLIASGFRAGVIYADPPWTYETYSGAGKQRSAEQHYDCLSIEEIKALPIAQLAAKDCTLFLWAVCPELPGAWDIIKA
jgi:hypothetical protein